MAAASLITRLGDGVDAPSTPSSTEESARTSDAGSGGDEGERPMSDAEQPLPVRRGDARKRLRGDSCDGARSITKPLAAAVGG